MGRRLILAGGSGFLGGLLARHFIARGWNVVALTRAKLGQRSQPVRAKGNAAASAVDPNCRLEARQHDGDAPSYIEWDGRTLGEWTTALDGADAVINLAGRSVNCRYHARNRRLMLDSRVNATRVLGKAIARCVRPPRVWLNFSTATIYKHTFGPAWDEAGEIGATPEAKDAFSIEVATAWERAFHESVTPHTRKVALRSAMVFGLRACLKIPWASCWRGKGWMARRDEGGYPQRSPTEEQRSQAAFSAHTLRAAGLLAVARVGSAVTARSGAAPAAPPWPRPKSLAAGPHAIFRQALSNDANNVYRVLRRLVRFGLGGRMGSGRQFVSWIHETDFCRAIEFLIGREEIDGPVNLAAPNPLTNAEMMRVLRRVLGVPLGLPAAEWMLELGALFLRTETELIIKSRRVVPGRLLEAGFKFEFTHLEDAIRDLEHRL